LKWIECVYCWLYGCFSANFGTCSIFIEVDVTNIVKERKNKKCSKRERRREVNLHPIFAVAKALKDFPGLNISVDGDYIIKKEKINLWRHHLTVI
jgi:pyruvate/2-oxoglutarate dehydrogenase complex dihydrolipoamide acyltransferase (E2) component